MFVFRCGGDVFFFGYLDEPHSGAPGAANGGKGSGRIEVFNEHGGPYQFPLGAK